MSELKALTLRFLFDGVSRKKAFYQVHTRAARQRWVARGRLNGRQLPPIQRHSAAVSRRCMHYFFKWHRGGDQSEHRSHLPPKGFRFRSRMKLIAKSNLRDHWLPLIWHWRNRACRIGILPLAHWKLTPTWQPFWAVFSAETGCHLR